MKFFVHCLTEGKCLLHTICSSLYKQYLVLELVMLINGPTSDIFILVSWPIRTAAVFPSGGSIRLRWQFLELVSSGGDGMSHK